MSRRQMMLAAARRPSAAPPPAVNVGPIDFTVAQGYADATNIFDHPEWVGQTILSGTGELTVSGPATHVDQIPREHADMSNKGTRILHHTTAVTDNHRVSVLMHTDTMSGGEGQSSVMLHVRGQAGSPESGYVGRLQRRGIAAVGTSWFQLHRMDAGVLVELLYESPTNVNPVYSKDDPHELELEANGNVITLRCDTDLIVAHDITGDAIQYATGGAWGWGMEREYSGAGSNTQVVSVDLMAASL